MFVILVTHPFNYIALTLTILGKLRESKGHFYEIMNNNAWYFFFFRDQSTSEL